ncbi:MAG TPA: hypothetical protein VGL19_12295, partial [Polyangiaceae bacterium]
IAGASVSRAGSCGPGDDGFARAGVDGAVARVAGAAGRALPSGARGTNGGICTGALELRGSDFFSDGGGNEEASSATRCAGCHSAMPLRQTSESRVSAPPPSAARSCCSLPDAR